MSTRQLVSLALAFVAVVGLVASTGWWVTRPTYTLLFDDMDQAAAAEVVSKLKAQKIDYQLHPVAAACACRRRRSIGCGWTSRRRAAELGPHRLRDLRPHRVRRDRVPRAGELPPRARRRDRAHHRHASPKSPAPACTSRWRKDSLFGEREQPAKASVVLKLRDQPPAGAGDRQRHRQPGRRQRRRPAAGSGGHPRQLRPAARQPTADDDDAARRRADRAPAAARARAVRRVVALLEPVVGADRVRVNVACASIGRPARSRPKRAGIRHAVIRSQQMTTDGAPTSTVRRRRRRARATCPPPPAPTRRAAGRSRRPRRCWTAVGTIERDDELRGQQHDAPHRPAARRFARLSVAVILDDEQRRQEGRQGHGDAIEPVRASPRSCRRFRGSWRRRSASTRSAATSSPSRTSRSTRRRRKSLCRRP